MKLKIVLIAFLLIITLLAGYHLETLPFVNSNDSIASLETESETKNSIADEKHGKKEDRPNATHGSVATGTPEITLDEPMLNRQLFESFRTSSDYQAFINENIEKARAGDANAQYLVAKAIMDCYGLQYSAAKPLDDKKNAYVSEHISDLQQKNRKLLGEYCQGVDYMDPEMRREWFEIATNMLEESSENGNSAAEANMLLKNAYEDYQANEEKEFDFTQFDHLAKQILDSKDPYAIRKLSEYFQFRQSELPLAVPEGTRLGSNPQSIRLGFELAACSMGYPCDPGSAIVVQTCAQMGGSCEENWNYYDVVSMLTTTQAMMDDANLIQSWLLTLIRDDRLDELFLM